MKTATVDSKPPGYCQPCHAFSVLTEWQREEGYIRVCVMCGREYPMAVSVVTVERIGASR